MKRLLSLLALLAPAVAWSCSDGSGGGGGYGGVNSGIVPFSQVGGSANDGMAGSAAPGEGTAGEDMVDDPMAGGPLSFASDIHPFLLQKCAGSGCHSSGSGLPEHASENVDDAYAATQETSTTGDPVHVRMVERTRGDDPGFVMPPSYALPLGCQGPPGSSEGCLTEDEFSLLETWSMQGANP